MERERIDIRMDELGATTRDEAVAYAAFLADYLDREMAPADHLVVIGAGGRTIDGYDEVLRDAWEDWCGLYHAQQAAWMERGPSAVGRNVRIESW